MNALVLALVLTLPAQAEPPTNAAEARSRLKALKQDLDDKRKGLKQLDDKTRSLLLTVNELDRSLHQVEKRAESATEREAAARREAAAIDDELREEVAQLENIRRRLRHRLRALYVLGEGAVARAMMGAERFEDLALRRRLLQKVGADDAVLFRKHREGVLRVEQKRSEKQHRLELAETLAAGALEEKELVVAARAERQAAIARIDEEKELAMRAVREIVAEQRELGGFLGALIRKSPPQKRVGRGILKGGLARPTRGGIIRRFGIIREQASGAKVQSNGIHIRAPMGASVRAAAGGTVAHEGWLRGFGLMIIVDHGEGHHTLYAHLSRAFARGGDRVERGQLIGHVGDTGSLNGPKLYFELRDHGRPKNPVPYLRK